MATARTLLADLRHLDRAPIEILHADEFAMGPEAANPDAVVDCARLLLLIEGELAYTIENTEVDMASPAMIYVPSWTRRHWLTVSSEGGRLAYVEFILPGQSGLASPALAQPLPMSAEFTTVMRRVIKGVRQGGSAAMLASLELKAIMGRFLGAAEPIDTKGKTPPVVPEEHIDVALRWLDEHLADPDALSQLPRVTRLTPDYLRRLFKEHTGMPPKQYLTVQRMRAARFALRQTDRLVKEIAAHTGYGDAFHFSRQYRRFWGISPSAERSR